MSLSGIPNTYTATGPTSAQTPGVAMPMAPNVGHVPQQTQQQQNHVAADVFMKARTEPGIYLNNFDKTKATLLNPIDSFRFFSQQSQNLTNETAMQRLHMYSTVEGALGRQGRRQLKELEAKGTLSDIDTDNGRSTLYHLYAMLTTPRANGYSNQTLVRETVETLSQPGEITQKFAPLSENAAKEIINERNNGDDAYARPGQKKLNTPLDWEDLDVDASATCVASSLMYYMAAKQPGELTRHLNELTSPMNAFSEKMTLAELSPDNPQAAYQILDSQGIKYECSGPNEVIIKVELPTAGVTRAQDSQKVHSRNVDARNAIETAYQSALTHLATNSYDPASDMRDSDEPGAGSKGLTEQEKTLMETIIKDNGGVQSITYQIVDGKANPQPGEEANSYLYGYTRTFEQTLQDIAQANAAGEPVIIGTTDTDETGSIVTGHEITIVKTYTDATDGEIKFVVADSDDGVPDYVVREARELIPKIHHAGFPLQQARQINAQINALPASYYQPGAKDQAAFNIMPFRREIAPTIAEGFTPGQMIAEANAQQNQQTEESQAEAVQSTMPQAVSLQQGNPPITAAQAQAPSALANQPIQQTAAPSAQTASPQTASINPYANPYYALGT